MDCRWPLSLPPRAFELSAGSSLSDLTTDSRCSRRCRTGAAPPNRRCEPSWTGATTFYQRTNGAWFARLSMLRWRLRIRRNRGRVRRRHASGSAIVDVCEFGLWTNLSSTAQPLGDPVHQLQTLLEYGTAALNDPMRPIRFARDTQPSTAALPKTPTRDFEEQEHTNGANA